MALRTQKKLQVDKVNELMEEYYFGNYNRFARALKVDPSHLHRFLNTGVGGGSKIISAVMTFCEEHELDFKEYYN